MAAVDSFAAVSALIRRRTLSCDRIDAPPPLVIAADGRRLPSALVKIVKPALASFSLPPTKSGPASALMM